MRARGVREYLRAKPHVVYRCYSHTGVLLYVGCTTDLTGRLRQHRGYSSTTPAPWYPLTARVTFEEFPNADEGRAAELAAVTNECPVFNVTGTGKWSPRATGFVVEAHVPAYVPRHAA